jgi:hypothetical protein
VFGGGHVVLPLIRSEVVPPGWFNDGVFLALWRSAGRSRPTLHVCRLPRCGDVAATDMRNS